MFSKSFLLTIILLSASAAFSVSSKPVQGDPAIIPLPSALDVEKQAGISGRQRAARLQNGGQKLHCLLRDGILRQSPANQGQPGSLGSQCRADHPEKNASLSSEWYSIKMTAQGVTVSYTSRAEAFYAAQTLRQSLEKDTAHWALPCMTITDNPRFTWRGIMIDGGRNPRSIAELKTIIDLLARYKVNTIHWRLTQDQGWRLEIKKYPRLTSIGATRPESPSPASATRETANPSPSSTLKRK